MRGSEPRRPRNAQAGRDLQPELLVPDLTLGYDEGCPCAEGTDSIDQLNGLDDGRRNNDE